MLHQLHLSVLGMQKSLWSEHLRVAPVFRISVELVNVVEDQSV